MLCLAPSFVPYIHVTPNFISRSPHIMWSELMPSFVQQLQLDKTNQKGRYGEHFHASK